MRRGWYGLGLPLLFLLADCRPSRESMSAGEIGCAPGEITISDEDSSMGFAQSEGEDTAAIRLEYARPAGALGADPSAL